MTYTNGYQSPNTGASTYSPFNRTAGAQTPQYDGYPAAVPGNAPYAQSAPGMPTDSFVGPASHQDIDSLSGNIDNKIAQIRQAFSGSAPANPSAPSAPAASPVSDADIQWALQLEQKVKGGGTPTPEETARYENIAQRLTQSQAPQTAPSAPAAPAAPPVSDTDIQWALQLEQKVKGGGTPTPEETARYENIAQRLTTQQSGTQTQAPTQQAGTPRNWADWSKPFTVPAAPTMPLPIAGPGGQPHLTVPTSLRSTPGTPPPAAVLNQPPAASMMAGAPQQTAMPAQADIDWALQLEQKVNQQQYQPTPQETARYQNIAQAIVAAQQQGAQQAPAQQQAPVQPVQPVSAPQQPQAPQQQFPTQQPQMAPQQAQAPQAGANLPPGLSQQELNWALQLEERVKQGYTPNQQELAAYENIAQRLQQANTQAPQQQFAAPQQQQAPGTFQQNGPQWVTPQGAPATQLVPQSYPHVQQGTPQALVPPPPLPQYTPPQAQGYTQQPGMPPQFQPGQQAPPQQQAPGFLDKAKAAWNMLWS